MYLDTAILVKLLVREPDSDFYVSLVDGQPAWSSQLTVVECRSALFRKERERAIDAAHRRRAWRQVTADTAAHRLSLVAVTGSLIERANAILEVCHPGVTVAVRSIDSRRGPCAEPGISVPGGRFYTGLHIVRLTGGPHRRARVDRTQKRPSGIGRKHPEPPPVRRA